MKLTSVNIIYQYTFFVFACLLTANALAQTAPIKIDPSSFKKIGKVDERYQSFNVEMVEVVGGDFWIPYDKIDTTKKLTAGNTTPGQNRNLYRPVPAIDLYEKRLRMLASALGPTYIRVSGTWANSAYFQNNDKPKMAKVPEGYKNILSRKEWKGVVDFVKAVNAKLVTSFAISDGTRGADGIWLPIQAHELVTYTKSIGGDIAAAEYFNEPTYASHGAAPKGYNAKNFAKDIAVFKDFVKADLPNMVTLGPGGTGEGVFGGSGGQNTIKTPDIMSAEPNPKFDVFSYHFYGGASRRCLPSGPGALTPDSALTVKWLHKTVSEFNLYAGWRDRFMPGKAIWLTETADAACGGNPWAVTFLDCFRYIEQLGLLAQKGVQVVMHNTLSASEYGLLDQDTHTPRPNYWTALLWSRLMGTEVYDAGSAIPGVDLFAHSSKKGGITLLVVNTLDNSTDFLLSAKAEQYMLTATELQSKKIELNGKELLLTTNAEIPPIKGKTVKAGTISLPSHSITFFSFSK